MPLKINDVFQVNNEFVFQGDANIYSWYIRSQAVVDDSFLESDLLEFGTDREDALKPLQSPNVQFRCVTGSQVWPDKSLTYLKTSGTLGTRTPVNGDLPGQCSLVITLYGDPTAPTKNNRGRDFWTGLDCADQINGVWLQDPADIMSLFVLMYAAMGNVWTSPVSNNTYSIGLFSMTQAKKTVPQNGNPPVDENAVFWWELQKVRAKSLVRTQRRRAAQDPCEFFIDGEVEN